VPHQHNISHELAGVRDLYAESQVLSLIVSEVRAQAVPNRSAMIAVSIGVNGT